MQIFSKLQRNSTNYIFIIFIVFFINILNSSFVFFPLFLGFFLFCADYFTGLIFIVLFSILHSYNVLGFFIFYLFYKFFLIQKINEYIDKQYFDIVSLFVVYLFFYIYLMKFIEANFDFIYLIYNFSFDLLIIRIFKCEPDLYYL